MLKIRVPGEEFFDEVKEEFVEKGSIELELEHSLASISKWESIWEKPFLSPEQKTSEETLSYIECMILTENVTRDVIFRFSPENFQEINKYIDSKMSATWFSKLPGRGSSREVVTAEIIYYWMLTLQIPMECQFWHIGRLFTLIRVVNEKNAPKQKMSKREALARQRALNEQRLAQLRTTG